MFSCSEQRWLFRLIVRRVGVVYISLSLYGLLFRGDLIGHPSRP